MKNSMIVMSIFLSVAILGTASTARAEDKQSYASVSGQVQNEWKKPAAGIVVNLSSQTNGFAASNNLSSTSDVNGNYTISNIPRYIYSSGTEPKPVEYYLTVNNPGYEPYAGETFNFKDSASSKKDVRLKDKKS